MESLKNKTDDQNPTGPAQPSLDSAYETKGNAATKEPAEQAAAQKHASDKPGAEETRIPTKQTSSTDEATPNAMGRGIHGAPPGEEAKGNTEEDMGRHKELDAQQMAAPGEGEVAAAVEDGKGKTGASGAAPDTASDLDRKKAEQAEAREAIKEKRAHDVDVGGILGQRGGPANPVDKNNYPNSGD